VPTVLRGERSIHAPDRPHFWLAAFRRRCVRRWQVGQSSAKSLVVVRRTPSASGCLWCTSKHERAEMPLNSGLWRGSNPHSSQKSVPALRRARENLFATHAARFVILTRRSSVSPSSATARSWMMRRSISGGTRQGKPQGSTQDTRMGRRIPPRRPHSPTPITLKRFPWIGTPDRLPKGALTSVYSDSAISRILG